MTIYKTPGITLDSIFEQSLFKDYLASDVTGIIQSAIDSLDANTVAYLKTLLDGITAEMQEHFDRRITPYYQAKTFKRAYLRGSTHFYDPTLGVYVLTLDKQHGDDVLTIDSVSWNGTTVTSTYYDLPYVNQANHELHIDPDANLDSLDDFSDYVTITGTWGYHDNWSNAWADTGDTVQNTTQISASDTTLSVSSTSNFEVYQLIKIESEYLFITSKSGTNLTVERGVNGTTAAIHANGTSISKYVPMPSVAKELRRMVVRSFFLRNPINNVVVSSEAIKELGEGAFNKVLPYRGLIGIV